MSSPPNRSLISTRGRRERNCRQPSGGCDANLDEEDLPKRIACRINCLPRAAIDARLEGSGEGHANYRLSAAARRVEGLFEGRI